MNFSPKKSVCLIPLCQSFQSIDLIVETFKDSRSYLFREPIGEPKVYKLLL